MMPMMAMMMIAMMTMLAMLAMAMTMALIAMLALKAVAAVLDSLGLAYHAKLFAEAQVDGQALALMEKSDVLALGMPLGDALKVWEAVKTPDAAQTVQTPHPSRAPRQAAPDAVPRNLADADSLPEHRAWI